MSIRAAELFVSVGADTSQGEQGLQSFNSKMNNAAKSMTMTGGVMTAGVTLPLLAIGKAALTTAMDFEQNMNILQQVSGASADTMQALQAEALRLGAVTSFSAGEAAEGMLELAKAGMSTEDVLASIGGVMDLAAAGGISLAEAAAITAATLNAFHLEASESGRVADLLAAAANASAASISDLSQGMQQAGFAFSMANQPVENLATSLAILTNVGLTGSDAGTALKNAFMRMMNPTAEAKGIMDELGISFYDAAGNMKALPDIIDVLNVATAGLTDEQRDQALATIFLSDGMKAMIPLMDAGSAGFNTMLGSVTEAGAATDVADARMRGLSGGIEYLMGSVDSFLIGAGMPFLDTLGGLARGAGDLLTQFGELPQPILDATLAFLGMMAAIGPLLLVLGGIAAALASPLLPIALLIVGISALSAAWIANVGGIQEITATAFGAVVSTAVELWTALRDAGPASLEMLEAVGLLPSPLQGVGRVIVGVSAAALLLWSNFGAGSTSMKDLVYWFTVMNSALGPEFLASIVAAGLALNELMTSAKSFDLKGLWGDTTQMATKLTGQLQVGLAMEVDWSQLRVNAEGMVTRAGERLSAIDWTLMSVNFGGLLSTAAAKITEQADKYLGPDNLVSNTVGRITGVLATLKTTFEGASFDEPLDLFNRTVTGVLAIMGLIGGVKADATATAITTLQSLLTGVLDFATGIVAGVDPALLAKAATGLVTGFTDQIVAVTQEGKLLELGTAAGSFAATLITKLGETLGSESFGTDVGTAVGQGTAAFLTGALALTAGIVGELAAMDFATLIPQIQTFTNNFIAAAATELAKGDYLPLAGAILTGIGTALLNLIQANPLNLFNLQEQFEQGQREEIEQGTSQLSPEVQEILLNPAPDPTWADIGNTIADGFNRAMGNSDFEPTQGPAPILSQQKDLLTQQKQLDLFGQAPEPVWITNLLAWEPSTPQWITSILDWQPAQPQWIANILDWEPSTPGWVRDLLNFNFFGGSGSVEPQADSSSVGGASVSMVARRARDQGSGGRPIVQFTGPITINNGMDIEQLTLEIARRLQKRTR